MWGTEKWFSAWLRPTSVPGTLYVSLSTSRRPESGSDPAKPPILRLRRADGYVTTTARSWGFFAFGRTVISTR